MTTRLLQGTLLVATWMLLLASTDPVDAFLGIGAAVLVLALPRPGGPIDGGPLTIGRRLLGFPRFAAVVLWDVLRGTWDVALRVLHLRAVERPGFVEVPIGERTELGVAVSALATTLSPGSVLVDVDRDRGVMVLHVIDASDPDAVRAEHDRFYRSAQRGAFP